VFTGVSPPRKLIVFIPTQYMAYVPGPVAPLPLGLDLFDRGLSVRIERIPLVRRGVLQMLHRVILVELLLDLFLSLKWRPPGPENIRYVPSSIERVIVPLQRQWLFGAVLRLRVMVERELITQPGKTSLVGRRFHQPPAACPSQKLHPTSYYDT